jgi:hypothetical protein
MRALCRLNAGRGRLEGLADSDLAPGGRPRSSDAHFGLYDENDTHQGEPSCMSTPADSARLGCTLDLFVRRRVDRNLARHVAGAIEVHGHSRSPDALQDCPAESLAGGETP